MSSRWTATSPNTLSFVEQAVDLTDKFPAWSTDDVADRMRQVGWSRLNEECWQKVLNEIVRRVREEPWVPGTELILARPGHKPGYWTGLPEGDRVKVEGLHETGAYPEHHSYAVRSMTDPLTTQIILETQLEFPFKELI